MSSIPLLNFRLNRSIIRRLIDVRCNKGVVIIDCDPLFDRSPQTAAATTREITSTAGTNIRIGLVGNIALNTEEELCTNFALRVILCPNSVVRLAVANSNLLRRIRQILTGPIGRPTDEGVAIPTEPALLKSGKGHPIIAVLHLGGGPGKAISLPAVRVEVNGDFGGLDVNAEDDGAATLDFSFARCNRSDRLVRALQDIALFISGHRCHLAVGRRPFMVVPPVAIHTAYGYLTTDIQGLERSTRILSLRSSNRRNLDAGPLNNLIGRNGVNAIFAGNLGGLVSVRHGDALELVVLGRLNGQGKVLVSRDLNVLGLGDLLLLALGVGQSDGAVLDLDGKGDSGLLLVLDGRVVGLGGLLLGRRLGLGDGLGGDLDRGAVGHVGGGEGVLAALVGGDVRLRAVGSHGLDGSDLLTVIGRNRELEVKGAVDHRGLVGRVGSDVLLAVLVIGERGTGNVKGKRGGGVLDDGCGLVGELRRRVGSRRGSLGLDGLGRGLGRGGLDGLGRLGLLLRLHGLRSLLVDLRFRSLRNRGGSRFEALRSQSSQPARRACP